METSQWISNSHAHIKCVNKNFPKFVTCSCLYCFRSNISMVFTKYLKKLTMNLQQAFLTFFEIFGKNIQLSIEITHQYTFAYPYFIHNQLEEHCNVYQTS